MIVSAMLSFLLTAAVQEENVVETTNSLSAFEQAAAFCLDQIDPDQNATKNKSIKLPENATLYLDFPAAALKTEQFRPFSELPELVKRFAATQPMLGRMYKQENYFKFEGLDSIAWALPSSKISACDVMVTQSSNYIENRDALLNNLMSSGWKLISPEISDDEFFWQGLFHKNGEGSKIVQMKLQGSNPSNANFDEIQMEVQFIVGKKKTSSSN